ncbi:MAG: HAMP domain-containing histidine kinase [Clostridiaceae bacterium]|nr:HAMP domain-containing histidine kinase [Clostridiaceae bacterium]
MLQAIPNRAQKQLILLALALLPLLLLGSWLAAEAGAGRFVAAQLDQDAALIGILTEQDHGGLDPKELAAVLDGQADRAAVSAGKTVLAGMGMTDAASRSLFKRYQPVRRAWFWSLFVQSLLVLLLVFGAAWFSLAGIFRQIRRLSAAASAVEHNRPLGGRDSDREGDLAALWRMLDVLAERSAARMRDMAADRQFLKSFLSDVSHQIKTPLASLSLYHDLLLADGEMPSDQRRSFLAQGMAQLGRIDWLVQGLLKMARLEARAVPMDRRKADLAETVRAAAAPFARQAVHQQVELVCQLPEPLLIEHDPDWVAEAFSNLIKNALEHTPPGGRVTLEGEAGPISIQIQIRDTGSGLDSAEIPFLFERFYRGTQSVKPNAVGIGLSLARTILERNGADLSAAGMPGQGAVFTATFLRQSASDQP